MYPAQDIPTFVMYCVNGASRSSLLIESTDSMINYTFRKPTPPLLYNYNNLRLLLSWLHMLHCTVVITLGNLASFPSLPCAYNIYYDYAVLLLISLLLHIATCIMLERGTLDKPLTFDIGFIQLSFHTSLFT